MILGLFIITGDSTKGGSRTCCPHSVEEQGGHTKQDHKEYPFSALLLTFMFLLVDVYVDYVLVKKTKTGREG